MTTKKKINIGFDIGITSVGWSLVDEENNIIDRGVRLFQELKNPKDGKLLNQERSAKRKLRRLIRRKQNRKLDFIKLVIFNYENIFNLKLNNIDRKDSKLLKSSFLNIINNTKYNNVLEIKNKAIKSEIDKISLLKILYNYISHRGFTYVSLEDYEEKKEIDNLIKNAIDLKPAIDFYRKTLKEFVSNKFNEDSKEDAKKLNEIIKSEFEKYDYKSHNFKSITSFISSIKYYVKNEWKQNKLPSQIQSEIFLGNQKFRGMNVNDSFSIYDWKKEIEIILKNQTYLDNKFANDFMAIFNRIRDFSEGPGISSEYGLYTKDSNYLIKPNDGAVLWDKLIGECSVYTNENRANKKDFSSEISNLLNQLNTLKVDNKNRDERYKGSLTENEKKQLIFDSLIKNKELNIKMICDVLHIEDKLQILHYPTDLSKDNKDAKTKFDKLDNSRKLVQIFNNEFNFKNFDDIWNKRDLFNNIVEIFSKFPENIEKQKEILKNKWNFSSTLIDELILTKLDSTSTSSMSLKALNGYINDEIKTKGKTVNQKYKNIIDKNIENSFNFDVEKSKYINFKCLDDEVLSPTTKCSFRETLKVFNSILKKYIYNGEYFLKNIVIEMPTEWNSKDERDKITKSQREREKRIELIKKDYDYHGNDNTVISKLNLSLSQDGKDVYDGMPFDIQQIINNPNYCDIDHIIPYSVSYDDSFNNKVLTKNENNKNKKNKIPYQFLESSKFNGLKYGFWKELFTIENTHFFNKKKYENLIKIDIESDNQKASFIGRNLSDTRYACRIANQAINSWLTKMKENDKYKDILSNDEINIVDINGGVTQKYRKANFLNIKKDRDDFSHHAIDATICAILGNSDFNISKLVWHSNRYVNEETGEVSYKNNTANSRYIKQFYDLKNFDEIKWNDLSSNVRDYLVKFSYKVNKKNSFGFWGDTILSVKKDKDNNFIQIKKQDLLECKDMVETDKLIVNLKELYIKNDKLTYSDPKLWNDVMKCYEEGKKISLTNDDLKSKNPFKLYLNEYCKLNNINSKQTEEMNRLIINRDGYVYYVKSLKTEKAINSFAKIKKNIDDTKAKFGAYSGLDWKEIRLYKDNKNKYKVIPMQINLFKYSKELKTYEIDQDMYNNLLKEKNVTNDIFFTIHKGATLVNKNDSKDLIYIVGIDFLKNCLDYKFLYKKTEKQNQTPINTILDKYDFCDIDILGNVFKIFLEKDIFKQNSSCKMWE